MRKLVQLRAVTLDATARRLGACYDVADLRRAARRRIPRPVFDYVDGAADEEISVAANVAAFRSWRFLPRVLAGVASADTSVSLFGAALPVPFLLGPAGYTRMLHPDGEIGAARSALRHGVPYTLSTMASTGIEELRAGVEGAQAGAREPRAGAGEPRTVGGEPRTGTREPRTGAGEPRAGTEEARAGTGEPRTVAGEPRTGTREPRAGTGEPRAGAEEARAGTGEPRTDTGEARAGTGEARTGTREPRTGTGEPRTGTGEPRAGVGPAGDLWFQLYLTRNRAQAFDLVSRAADNGYSTLVLTVDTIVAGNRVRDLRNGLSIPPALTLSTVASVAARPSYWYRLLSGPALDYANFAGRGPTTVMKTADFFDADLNWSDISDLRSRWAGKLLLKGPVGAADARRALELGVDGVQLSNHGGRQLDRSVAPVDLIAPVREAVGPSFTVLVDSGVRHGADVAIALALGADAAVLGRAYLYGLMAGGEPGVDRALDLLSRQFRSTMQFLGVTSVAELRKHGRDLITRATS